MIIAPVQHRAADYAEEHGLDPSRCHVVVGTQNGETVFFTPKYACARWLPNRDFERDGGVFATKTAAVAELKKSRAEYGEHDDEQGVVNVRVLPVFGISAYMK